MKFWKKNREREARRDRRCIRNWSSTNNSNSRNWEPGVDQMARRNIEEGPRAERTGMVRWRAWIHRRIWWWMLCLSQELTKSTKSLNCLTVNFNKRRINLLHWIQKLRRQNILTKNQQMCLATEGMTGQIIQQRKARMWNTQIRILRNRWQKIARSGAHIPTSFISQFSWGKITPKEYEQTIWLEVSWSIINLSQRTGLNRPRHTVFWKAIKWRNKGALSHTGNTRSRTCRLRTQNQ